MNKDKLNEFLGKFVTDLGATVAAGNVVIGHRLGLYRTLAREPATPEQLAERTGFVLANPDGAVYAPGAFVLAFGALQTEEQIADAFRTGAGLGRHEHDESVGLLQLLHAAVRTERHVPARRLRPRRPGRRGRHPAPGDRGGLHQVPPRRRDPVQPGLRGATMITVNPSHRAAGQLVARLSEGRALPCLPGGACGCLLAAGRRACRHSRRPVVPHAAAGSKPSCGRSASPNLDPAVTR
jgi:hypothetical protein